MFSFWSPLTSIANLSCEVAQSLGSLSLQAQPFGQTTVAEEQDDPPSWLPEGQDKGKVELH